MKRIVDVVAKIRATKGVEISFADALEISLDCFICRRMQRTVCISTGEGRAQCYTGHGTHHDFPARIVDKTVETQRSGTFSPAFQVITYRIEYEVEPFEDKKYKTRKQSEFPTWGRVAFMLSCPDCAQTTHATTQNNIVRPWTCFCKCGKPLYAERDEMPLFVVE